MMEIDRPRDAAAAAELESRVRTRARRRAQGRRRLSAPCSNASARWPTNSSARRCPCRKSHASEARALLAWMHDGHFVFLGYRHYHLKRGRSRDALVRDSASGLGILRLDARRRQPILLTGHLRQQARAPELLVLTKANTASTVHRGSYLDYVGVKTFDASGQVTGEHRFLGPVDLERLSQAARRKFRCSAASSTRSSRTSACRHKATTPSPWSTSSKLSRATNSSRLRVGELIASVRGIVNLYERRRVRLFVRRDSFERFYSCLVYVPRDRYNTEVRERIERIVRQRFGGTHVETQVQISDSMLARLHMLVRTPQGARAVEDIPAIEAEIAAAAATWEDRLQQALISRGVGAQRRGARGALRENVSARLSRRRGAGPGARRHRRPRGARCRSSRAAAQPARASASRAASCTCASCARTSRSPISDILPMLENFGLRVLAEHPYQVTHAGTRRCGSRTSSSRRATSSARDIAALEPLFKEAFLAAWRGDIENDGFNRLLLCAVAERARHRGGARLLPLPAADRHPVQPGVHGTRARRAGADHRRAGAAVPDAVRARQPRARKLRRSASPRASSARSTRCRVSTKTASCAATSR